MPPRAPPRRSDYPVLERISTRWMDNDLYGHVNNAHYYSYFDSVVNRFLVERGGLDIHGGPVVGFVVRSECDYLAPVAYPEPLDVGLRVEQIGNSSVRYGLAIFAGADDAARAAGAVVHVFVDRATSKPVSVPEPIRRALAEIAVEAG